MKRILSLILSKLYELFKSLVLIFRKPSYTSKVFCIGFYKTGTTTVGKSLEMLGYRNSSFDKKVWEKYYKKNEIVNILKFAAKFDSVDDLPWLKEDMIPVLDRVFPNSKFIYLFRDEESWQKSLYNFFYQVTGIYPNLEKHLQSFRKHKKFVLDYFRDRPANQFIILDVRDKKGFKKLAEFLGKQTTREEFPHFNKTKTNPTIMDRWHLWKLLN